MMSKTTHRGDFLRSAAASTLTVPYWLTAARTWADRTKAKKDRPNIGAIGVGGKPLGQETTMK